VFTYKGEDVVKTILQFAKEYRVGHVVVGRSGRKLPLWKRLPGNATLVQRLVEESKGVTVVVLDTREVGTGATARAENSVLDADTTIRPPSAAKAPASFPAGVTVLLWHEPMEKEAATRQLLAACCRENKKISEPAAWEALVERERQGSTFLGEDVALPHARLAGVEHAVVGLGVAKQRVSDPATGKSVRIVFLLLSPVSPPEVHVRYLSLISRLTQHALLRQELLKARNAEEAVHVLKEHAAGLVPHVPAPN
jgi:two-component system sensor histidine kinase KdpD